MIPIEALRQIKTLVTHANCPDGIASAMIIRDCLPHVDVRFMSYNTAEHIGLEPSPGMLFCDFSPHPSRVADFVAAGAIVLDHHKTQREIVSAFGERGVYADGPGIGGAVLALRKVWEPCRWRGPALLDVACQRDFAYLRELAYLAGIRDTWQKDHPDWPRACEWAEALRFWPIDTILATPSSRWRELVSIGPILIEKARDRDRKTLEGAHWFDCELGRVCCFQGLHTSDIAEMATSADIIAGWHYSIDGGKKRMQVSLRSRSGVDVSKIAKRYGGGGHTAAAGFELNADAWTGSPWRVLEHLFCVDYPDA